MTDEFDVYLPLRTNTGAEVPRAKIEAVKRELKDRFGGYTYFPQTSEGAWRLGTVTYHDELVIVRVLAERAEATNAYFQELKARLCRELAQEDLLVVRRSVETL